MKTGNTVSNPNPDDATCVACGKPADTATPCRFCNVPNPPPPGAVFFGKEMLIGQSFPACADCVQKAEKLGLGALLCPHGKEPQC